MSTGSEVLPGIRHSNLKATTNIDQADAEMLSYIRCNAPQLIHRLQNGRSNPPFELVWAAHKWWPFPFQKGHHPLDHSYNSTRPLRISILDASFNPPTLAHLALANSRRPKYPFDDQQEDNEDDYDAKLLLLSVKNADKTLKPGDVTYLQRLEMMGLLARDVTTTSANGIEGEVKSNVAVAIIDEPTFVGKSRVLNEVIHHRLTFLSSAPHSSVQYQPEAQLTFIIGLDTLERLFSPRYYPPSNPSGTAEQTMMFAISTMLSPSRDNSLVICAHRSSLAGDLTQQDKGESTLAGTLSLANQFLNDERIVMIDIGDRESRFSSTAVRNARERASFFGSEGGAGAWKEWVTNKVGEYVEQEGLYLALKSPP